MAETKIDLVSYGGWPNCYRLVNDDRELIVTTDVGPRVIRCGFTDSQNLFAELPSQMGQAAEIWWMMRGGHRLWIAPEVQPATYALDNHPVDFTLNDDGITLLQPWEPETELQKEITIRFEPSGGICVTHRIENRGNKSRLFAPWALTAMAPGGVAISTFPRRTTSGHPLQPSHPLVMWSYTNFSDPRWTFTSNYLVLRQDSARPEPQKAGLFNEETCSGYLLGTDLFLKRTVARANLPYPDYHSSVELFTNHEFLELETLGPLIDLKPDSSTTHREYWFLRRNVTIDSFTDEGLDRTFQPLLASTRIG